MKHTLIAFFLFIVVVPLLWSLGYSLTYSLGLFGNRSHGFTLDAWQHVLSGHELWRSLGFSFYVALTTLVLTITLALSVTLLLKNYLARGPLAYALYVPLALPSTVAALYIMQMFGNAGLLARVAWHLGWITESRQFPSLIYDSYGLGIMLTHLLLATPLFVLLFNQLYNNEKLTELTALAMTLGANRLDCVRRVILPILLRRASPNLTLFFIGVFGSFEIPYKLGPQSPQMISVLTHRKFSMYDLSQKPEAYAIAVLYMVLALGLLATVFRKQEAGHAG